MSKRLHVEYSLLLTGFNENWIFSRDFRKKVQISSFIKIRLVGPELFHADRRTDMTKLIVAFRNFAKAPKDRDYFSDSFRVSGDSVSLYAHIMHCQESKTNESST